jgi:CheY-like chemotaxis protein
MPPENYQKMQFSWKIAIFALNHGFYHKAKTRADFLCECTVKNLKGNNRMNCRIIGISVLEEFVRILIIDDDPASTDLLRLLLASYPAEVVSTNHPAEGIELARKLKPDLILLDLWMPELNGLDVCKTIRRTSSVPILILSALDTPETIADVLNAGADDYLVKPVTRNILQAYIKKFARVIQTGPLLVSHAAL